MNPTHNHHGSHCRPAALAALLLLALTSCRVTEDYRQPPLETPTTFKSATTQEADVSRLDPNWWQVFDLAELTSLEETAVKENQDLKAAVARVDQARAATRSVASQFYPVITLDPSATRGQRGGASANSYRVPFDLSYEVDIWGRVRRTVEAARATETATAEQVAVVRLTLTSDVAQNYFTLRSLDSQMEIVARNLQLYRRQVDLVDQQLKAGIVTKIDLLQAQALLDSTRAQEIDLRRQRADTEHALAILLGKPPAALNLESKAFTLTPPKIPVGLPADLLARRPDVASAEQNLAAACAQIGVAKANFYPVVRLTGTAGFESISAGSLFNWESRLWSIGPSASIPIFEGGQLEAGLAQAKARYEELLATWRGTVLTAFREVEDALTDLHHRSDQAEAQASAIAASREALRLIEVQYKQGLANYLQVIDADRTLLANELAAAQTDNQRLVASVLLIKALGGGWSSANAQPAQTQPAPTPTQPAATQP